MKHPLILAFVCATLTAFSQSNPWAFINEKQMERASAERWIVPQKYQTVQLDAPALAAFLERAPERFHASGGFLRLSLPLPDGSFQDFAVTASPILPPSLASQFPDLQTFSGQGIDDPSAAVYLDLTTKGFHGMVLKPGKVFYIDPYFNENTSYFTVYDREDFESEKQHEFHCELETLGEVRHVPSENMEPVGQARAAVSLRTYDIAMAANGEYTAFHGGTVNDAMAAIVTTLNRIRGVFETELAISFMLVADNDQIVYTDGATDPYSNPPTMAENQTNIDAIIGNGNYDIGHVMGTGTGGVASVGVVCNNAGKARGMTASNSPVGDPFDIDFVAHEIGHQFGAHHSFNGNIGSCSGSNRTAATAYEPGSGSTIMSYAGLCSTQNIQRRSFSYFHRVSLNQITTFTTTGTGNNCSTTTATGNNTPTVNPDPAGMNGKYIPVSTPFELEATGNDPDGDAVFFNWEQWDLGTAGAPSSAQATGPNFRSLPPATSGSRVFPCLSDILDNTGNPGEFLPSVARTLNFQCTARDNRSVGGGNSSGSILLNVTDAAGPFAITSHNATAQVNGTITVTWNVASTTAAPVSCANVDILLSMDGGLNFTILTAATPNDGSQAVTLPSLATNHARIKVKCSDNVFFDINNTDLSIAPADANCGEEVADGDMEDYINWTEASTNGYLLIGSTGTQHGGVGSAYLGGANNEVSSISQTISIPSNAHSAELSFWYKFDRTDCGNDDFSLKINGAVVKYFNLCNDLASGDWTRGTIALDAYIGTSPTILFEATCDWANPSDVYVDDVSVYVCAGGTAFVLPVELRDFTVRAQGHQAMLYWSTESELDNLGHHVEMRTEATDFRAVGFLPTKAANGSGQQYDFVVNDLTAGIYYFRLRHEDLDGSTSYSPVRSAAITGENHVAISPNPASGVAHFTVRLEAATDLQLQVLDLMGRVVGQVAAGSFGQGDFKISFDVANLPDGTYFCQFVGNGVQESYRFAVKN